MFRPEGLKGICDSGCCCPWCLGPGAGQVARIVLGRKLLVRKMKASRLTAVTGAEFDGRFAGWFSSALGGCFHVVSRSGRVSKHLLPPIGRPRTCCACSAAVLPSGAAARRASDHRYLRTSICHRYRAPLPSFTAYQIHNVQHKALLSLQIPRAQCVVIQFSLAQLVRACGC